MQQPRYYLYAYLRLCLLAEGKDEFFFFNSRKTTKHDKKSEKNSNVFSTMAKRDDRPAFAYFLECFLYMGRFLHCLILCFTFQLCLPIFQHRYTTLCSWDATCQAAHVNVWEYGSGLVLFCFSSARMFLWLRLYLHEQRRNCGLDLTGRPFALIFGGSTEF